MKFPGHLLKTIILLCLSSLGSNASPETEQAFQKLNAYDEQNKVEALQYLLANPGINLKPVGESIINLLDQEMRIIIKDPETGYRKTVSPGKLAMDLCIASNTNLLDQLSVALIEQRNSIRWRVALIMGEINHPESVSPLLTALKNDTDRLVKITAAESLAKLGEHSFKPITELLDSDDPSAQEHAIWVLSEIQDPRILEKLFAIALKQNDIVALRAMEALPNLGPGAVHILRIILNDPTAAPNLKYKALYMAGKIKDVTIFTEIARILTTSRDENLRIAALTAFHEQQDVIGTDLILNMISDINPTIARNAYGIMLKMGGSSTPIILNYAANPNERIQQISMLALKAMGNNASPGLVTLINEPVFSNKIKIAAAGQLRSLRFPGVNFADMVNALYLLEDWSALSLMGKKIEKVNEKKLRSPKASDRLGAVLLLSDSSGVYYADRFVELLNDKDDRVRQAAYSALLKLERQAFPDLIALLGTEVSPRLKLASQILQRLNYKPKTDINKLLLYSAAQDWEKVHKIGEPAQTFLFETLLNRDYNKSVWSAWVLANLHDHKQLKNYETSLDEASLFELIEFKPKKGNLNNPFETLSYLSDYRATALLICLLFTNDEALVDQAIKAISKMNNVPLSMLDSCLKSLDHDIQDKALRCIESIGPKTTGILSSNIGHPDKKSEILTLLEEFNYRPKNIEEEIQFLLNTKQYKKLVSKGRVGIIPLINFIKSNTEVSPLAYQALGASDDLDVIPGLMDGLLHKDEAIVKASREAIKKLGDPAISFMKDLVAKANITYAKLAAESLKALNYETESKEEEIWLEVVSQNWDYLLKKENLEPVSKLLIPMLPDSNNAKRAIATGILAGLRESLIALQISENNQLAANISDSLTSSSPDVRGRAVGLIANYGTKNLEFIPELIKLLDDNAPMLDNNGEKIQTPYGVKTPALVAAEALSKMGSPAVSQLLHKLEDKNSKGYAYAKLAAASIADKRLVKHQTALLKANLDPVKQLALRSLTKVKAEEALPQILELYVKQHEQFSSEIKNSLPQFGDSIIPLISKTLLEHPEVPPLPLLEVAAKLNSPESAKLLIREFGKKGAREQRLIIQLMAASTQKETIDHLISLLKHDTWTIKESAIQSLTEIGAESTRPVIEAWAAEPEAYNETAPRILKKTSGLNFGKKLEAWKKWLSTQKAVNN